MPMSNPTHRLVCLGLLAFGLCAGLSGACFEAPGMDGFYACADDSECSDGLVCDDGVCCGERVAPLCVGRVLDGGMCTDGGVATRYYLDQDLDSFGNPTEPVLRCAVPTTFPVSTNDKDCNDNPAVQGALFHPNATETCDGLDNDCDGQLDEGLDGGTYYRDRDNDGFGDTRETGFLCRKLPGWVEAPNDCQPNEGTIYPGAREVCNGLDDNCNDIRDEGVLSSWYRDQDKDGFGRASMRIESCVQPNIDYVSNGDDCDDLNAARNPDALDVCDGFNNDCDSITDERPDCGGPDTLLDIASTSARGAVDTYTLFNGVTPGCLRNWPGGVPASLSASHVWSGSHPRGHVVWFEANRTWDLTKSSNNLVIHFNKTMSGQGTPPWAPHKQPIVLLCSESGYARYVPVMDGGVTPLMHDAYSATRTTLPIGVGTAGGWVERNTSLDLSRVKRVEILVEPNDGGVPNLPVAFDIEFTQLGFR
jgi:hypothetical protein